ncbi:MAG: oligosaccharide flippase family protein [Candidatus Aminicenantes bacterium]|nr:oligosaccharide flippase family protein [Candidatus Aminicenantes bacterium]
MLIARIKIKWRHPAMAMKKVPLIDVAGVPALVRGYAFVLAGNGAAGLLSFLIFVLLSRDMSLEGFGSFALFFTVMTLVWQIPAFIDSSYVRYARTAPPAGARAYLRVDLADKIKAVAWIGGLSPAAAFALSRWAFPGKTTFGLLVLAVAGGACLTFLASVIADLQAREAFAGYALGTVSFYAVALAVLFVMARRAGPLDPAAAGMVLAAAAVLAGGVALVWLARRARPIFPLDPEAAGRMRSLGKWILATSLLYVVLQRIDMLVVGHVFPAADVGVYSAASRLLSALTVFLSAASALYLPKAALAVVSRRALQSYGRQAAALTAFLLVVLAGLVVVAPFLVAVFFGPAFAGSAAATRALFLGHVPLVLALPLSYLLYGLEDSFSNFLAMAFCLAANIAANALLTPKLGIVGPGWAFGVGYAVYLAAVVAALFLRKTNRVRLAGLV